MSDILDSCTETVKEKKEKTARVSLGQEPQLARWLTLRKTIEDAEAELKVVAADICVHAEAARWEQCKKGAFASSIRLSDDVLYVWFCAAKLSKEDAELASDRFRDSFARHFVRTRKVNIDTEKLTATLDDPSVSEAVQTLQKIGVLSVENIFATTDAFDNDYASDEHIRALAFQAGIKPTAYLKMQRKKRAD